jgi:hypothetical protein
MLTGRDSFRASAKTVSDEGYHRRARREHRGEKYILRDLRVLCGKMRELPELI